MNEIKNIKDLLDMIKQGTKDQITSAQIVVSFEFRDIGKGKVPDENNIFIKNLDKGINKKVLHDTFSVFGNILSGKLASDSPDQSQGYGFVHFENEEPAQEAIENLNDMLVNDKKVYVGSFNRKQGRDTSGSKTNFNNVFVKNLSKFINSEKVDDTARIVVSLSGKKFDDE
ncbi:hypothetical protein GQ457_09G013240 [Hibiscus cannabinus]